MREGEKIHMYRERRTYKRKGAGLRSHYKQDFCTSMDKHPFQYSPPPPPLLLVPRSLRSSRVEPCNPSEEENECCMLNKTNQAPNDTCISNGPCCAKDSYYNGISLCTDKTWVIAVGAGLGSPSVRVLLRRWMGCSYSDVCITDGWWNTSIV